MKPICSLPGSLGKRGLSDAYGNATLIKKTVKCVRPFDLPACEETTALLNTLDRMEVVKLESGLYLGDRNTEPRAALVAHLVLTQLHHGGKEHKLTKPLDVFIVNVHLTTLQFEREGVPGIDEEGTRTRLRQIDIILEGIVSRYNTWRKEDYRIKNDKSAPVGQASRHPPIWIITGDFNFTPESIEYQTIVRRGFIDLLPNHDVGTKASGLGETPTLTVDYVFAGPRYEALDPDVARKGITLNHVEVNNDTSLSDHYPIIIRSVPIALAEE
jgi:hypothetical protein